MLSIAIPHYLNVEPEKPIKCQAAICDWLSNMGSHYFAVSKVCVRKQSSGTFCTYRHQAF